MLVFDDSTGEMIEVDETGVCLTETGESAVPVKHTLKKSEMRRGGQKGGPARARMLSPERRREIAQKAAQARWKA